MSRRSRLVFATSSPPVLTERISARQAREEAKNRDIPVLTDVLNQRRMEIAAIPPVPQPVATAPAPAPVPTAPSSPPSLENISWDEMENRLKERILKQVAQRMDVILDDTLSQHVGAVLQQIARLLADEIKHDMQNTLDVIVTHSISAELDRLKKRNSGEENI